ncbi:hypothetical protein [Micromonospora deserti]|uniref:Uncharacterized protein n=1 Tax=Micromonospora deserti TaxID=2070366 RepID=A0A2W2CFS9_9ACTN|nr:hypothetical protein [Micromonospora deserti]PZF98251.1 hypothetical protein C1I99_13780 [Micromonospora deserti]
MADLSAAQRRQATKQGDALPGGRFPIRNRGDLENAIRAVGRAEGGEAGRAKVRRFIMRRARDLRATNLIPATWAEDGTLKGS